MMLFSIGLVLFNMMVGASSSSSSKECTDTQRQTATSVLAAFASCSDFNADEITDMIQTLESTDNIVPLLKDQVTKCSTLSNTNQRSECFASYMNTLAEFNLFVTDRLLDDPDTNLRELSSTIDCLSQAYEELPYCQRYEPFFLFDVVLPLTPSLGLRTEIDTTCGSITAASKHCLTFSDISSYQDSEGVDKEKCESVLKVSDKCEDYLTLFWHAGLGGTKYCSLKEYQTTRVEVYFSACPSLVGETEKDFHHSSTSLFTFIQVLLFSSGCFTLVCGLAWHGSNRYCSRGTKFFTEDLEKDNTSALMYQFPKERDSSASFHEAVLVVDPIYGSV